MNIVDPVSVADIAERLRVTMHTVSNWERRYPDFPRPVFTVARGHTDVWEWGDVRRWAHRRNLPGPPKRRARCEAGGEAPKTSEPYERTDMQTETAAPQNKAQLVRYLREGGAVEMMEWHGRPVEETNSIIQGIRWPIKVQTNAVQFFLGSWLNFASVEATAVKAIARDRVSVGWAVFRLPDRLEVVLAKGQQVVRDDEGKPVVIMCECGTCGRRWNDKAISDVTPTPAGRCPFEYAHEDEQ